MKKFIFVVFAFTLLFSGLASADSIIIKFDTGLNATNHWYQRIDTKMNWDEAQAFAIDQGGYLATILSAEEDAFIFDNLNDGTNYWLGGNDVDTEGTWVWENGDGIFWQNGTSLLYTDFFTGEPNGSGDYLQYWPTNTGNWDDTTISHNNTGGNTFIVEYNTDPNAVPEPATMLLLGCGLIGLIGFRRKFKK